MAINAAVECRTSPSPISPNIKQESRDDRAKDERLSPAHHTPTAPIAFSITNILSNNFGKQISWNNNEVISDKYNFALYAENGASPAKRSKIDRPQQSDDENENDDEEIDVTDEQTKFHQNAAIDFSNAIPHHYAQNILLPQQHAHHHLHQQQLLSHYQAAMAVAHQSLYRAGIHNFIDSAALDRPQLYPEFYQQHHTQSLAKSLYPKLHEDILHSSKPYAPSYPTSPFAENAFSKYPPLGNLCKTVSQIGQNSDIPAPSFSVKKAASPARTDISPIKKSLKRPASQMNSSADTSESASTPKQTAKSSRMDSMDSGMESSDDTKSETSSTKEESGKDMFPAWIYCTRYSDRPSSGPRYRKPKVPKVKGDNDEKRPRTAFSSEQLARLKREFNENHYLNERRRQQLSSELGLNEAQIKIWFQNKRAKIKKTSGQKNPLAEQLMAQGLYNHSTVSLTKEEEELEMRLCGQVPSAN